MLIPRCMKGSHETSQSTASVSKNSFEPGISEKWRKIRFFVLFTLWISSEIVNLADSPQDSLDGESARRKVTNYTQEHKHTTNVAISVLEEAKIYHALGPMPTCVILPILIPLTLFDVEYNYEAPSYVFVFHRVSFHHFSPSPAPASLLVTVLFIM